MNSLEVNTQNIKFDITSLEASKASKASFVNYDLHSLIL